MSGSPSIARRPLAERLRAWVVTGPLGHCWSVVADVALLWGRWLHGRLRVRTPEPRRARRRR